VTNFANNEVMAWSEKLALHDTLAMRRRRFIGHILRLHQTRLASLALEWIPDDGRSRTGKPSLISVSLFVSYLETIGHGYGLDWCKDYCQQPCQM